MVDRFLNDVSGEGQLGQFRGSGLKTDNVERVSLVKFGDKLEIRKGVWHVTVPLDNLPATYFYD